LLYNGWGDKVIAAMPLAAALIVWQIKRLL